MNWQPIETLKEAHDCILLWLDDGRKPRAVFGRSWLYEDGELSIRGDHMTGDWTFTHWMLIDPPGDIQG